MYIRCLIPRNFAEWAEAVPISGALVTHFHTRWPVAAYLLEVIIAVVGLLL